MYINWRNDKQEKYLKKKQNITNQYLSNNYLVILILKGLINLRNISKL
jgi:hypothetical protein